MRILLITSGLKPGGAERMLLQLLTGLRDEGIDTDLLCLSGYAEVAEDLKGLGFSVKVLNIQWWNILQVFRAIFHEVRRADISLVQTWLYHADILGGLIARLATDKPVVWGIRNSLLEFSSLSFSTRCVLRLCRFTSKWVPHQIIACAFSAKTAHIKMGYPPDRIRVIQNSVDTSLYYPNSQLRSKFRIQYGLSDSTRIIGHVGRFDSNKNHLGFLRAIAHCKLNSNVKVLMCGAGVDEGNRILGRQIKDLDLSDNVLCIGRQRDMPAIYQSMDLYVLSSVSEGFPNTVAEAMACGVPCVVTDVGDAACIVADTGVIVGPHDDSAMTQAIDQCLQQMPSPEWQDKGMAAREHVISHFSLCKMASEYARIYRRLIK